MRDIAAEVGMEAASLYNHIKSKDDILCEICFSLADVYTLKMDEVYVSTDSPKAKLKQLIDLHIKINSNRSSIASVMNDEWRHLKPNDKKRFLDLRHDYENKFIEIIKSGIRSGQFKEVNPRISLFTMLSSMKWLLHWYYANWEFESEEVKQNLSQMIFDGILAHRQNEELLD